MYTINKPKELTKVTKLNAEEIFLADNTYYIKCVDTFYSMDKEMLKKISFGDRTGLCIRAYRELEDMQLLTMQGITTVKGFKVIEVEEVKDVLTELTELIDDKPVATKDSSKKDPCDKEKEEYNKFIKELEKFINEDDEEEISEQYKDHLDKEWEEEFCKPKKQISRYCPNCCGT